ncbi:lysM domain receptor-like protein kinase 3-like protein [Trifolium pratense]|uniref:LysM domain receptor-like protein kinase 3-like protein n=1 Tax=Trifolium pratense TaxID=57577 RepID=A0A2K3MYD8_TRIPR|nr:lysM domain receptor-like protein kinase 3-like protein [Trifolium pratense]
MCKSKMAIDASTPKKSKSKSKSTPRSTQTPPSSSSSSKPTRATSLPKTKTKTSSFSDNPSTSYASTSGSTGFHLSTDTSISSRTSLTSLRGTLPENPNIYDFSEICSATNNFLSKRYSSSTPCWHCTLRGADVIIFQRKFRRKLQTSQLRELLSVVCRSHHVSIIKLLGVSISGEHIYLVYEYVHGANLSDCLRNSRNVHFTVLSTWISRMQVATDLAHGLDYIHNKTGLNFNFVHNHIKSSAIVVTEPDFNARVCHFGAAQLCGEAVEENEIATKQLGEITEEGRSKELRSSDVQFEGVRGYMSPEFQSTGVATQKSDVYAFGVVMLELLSGEEPLKFKFDEKRRDFVRISVIESARAAVDGGDGDGSVEGKLRMWVDRRLKDSFPVDVAEKLTRVALDCVHVDPDKRPNMGRVAGKISTLYLKSKNWSDNMKMPDMSFSLGPR